jgi:hypothetical protein
MAKQHKIGGRRAQGFASLSAKKRRELASSGGQTCVAMHGREHMAALGAKGGSARGKDSDEK